MPRGRFFIYALFTLIVYLTLNYSAYNFLFPLFVFLLGLPVLSFFVLLRQRLGVRVAVTFTPDNAERGTERLLRCTVDNAGRLPVTVRVTLQQRSSALKQAGCQPTGRQPPERRHISLALAPEESRRFAISYIPEHRELLRFDLRDSWVTDLFGFFRLPLIRSVTRKLNTNLIWPRTILLDERIDSLSLEHEDPNPRAERVSSVINEIARLRDYAPGDKLRQIHWSVSAHLPELQVREFIDPYHDPVILLVPVISRGSVVFSPGDDPAGLALRLNDGCGDLASGVARRILDQGLSLQLLLGGSSSDEAAPELLGTEAMSSVNDRLALQMHTKAVVSDELSWGLAPRLINLVSRPPSRLVLLTFGLTRQIVDPLLQMLHAGVSVMTIELLAARQATAPSEARLRSRLQRAGGSFYVFTLSELLRMSDPEEQAS